jgi:alkaline phosphatase
MKMRLWTILFLSLSSAAMAKQSAPKNIIFMIGDGMGVAQTSAYRYFQDDPNTADVETTIFDQLLVGTAATYPADKTVVTDSAASATALSTGVKTYNGAIGVDVNKKPLKTILEVAKHQGKGTAIVSSSQINHATPASFMAHNEYRRNYDQIADSYVDERINGKVKADLMLGGGTDYFIREDRNLIEELNTQGFSYIDQLEQLHSLKKLPAIGLFAPTGLPFAIDNKAMPNRVTAMTETALRLMSEKFSDEGFFMMIEGSQIDWCAHANDIACAMAEMKDFASAVQLAHEFTQQNSDTLLVITADHATGGLSVGGLDIYEWRTEVVAQINSSVEVMLPEFIQLSNEQASDQQIQALWSKHVDFELTSSHLTLLKEAFKKAAKSGGKWPEMTQKVIGESLLAILNDATKTGWTTKGHNADDVQVFAAGKGATLFAGFQNNIDIGKKLLQLWGSK